MFSTVKTSSGLFNCLWNGKETGYSIFNGSHGTDGGQVNTYGVMTPSGQHIKIGTLANAKKAAQLQVTKAAKAA